MRILIVDDEPAVHDSYARSFARRGGGATALATMAAALFGGARDADKVEPEVELMHCHQGLDAVGKVERALVADTPFAVAFIDMRMPPGIDGRETARRIRALDSDIYLVIVTGHAGVSAAQVGRVAGPPDKIFYIAKPFEAGEVQQMASALGRRWEIDRELATARATLRAQVILLREQGAELAANESRAMHLATHDSLTDAPNRLAFQRALAERARLAGSFATAMVDLDRFKLVNDTLGHLAGDALIRAVCALLHEAAPMGAMIARLGGDEFGVLFDVSGEAAAVAACDRLVAACATSITVLGHAVEVGASAGLVVTPGGDGCDPGDALRRSDLALNAAKRAGKGITRLFDESMDEDVRFRRRIEAGLAVAVDRGEMSVVYQPIVGRDAFDIVGFEALLRWDTSDYGPIESSTFIPIAEESNLIHELGDWVLTRALAEVARWHGRYVSINFSPRQFRRSDFAGHLLAAVTAAGVEPSRVQVEITETAIFDDAGRAAETLDRLRAMGFRIALDDFGTGYSSLYNIRTFALDCLKIDRSFIDGMGRERESAAIVLSIIHLGRALGLEVIAGGVETTAQVQALRMAGASHLQGFYIARPVGSEIAAEMAAAGKLGGGDRAAPAATHGARDGTGG